MDRRKAGIRRVLPAWYRRNARDLPWRRTSDPYRIWLSEILLQQTRIETALPYYHRFTKAFPNVRALAAAEEDRVLKLWEGLGYYGRARNLQKAAKIIMNDHGGCLPETLEGWRSLPGVGRYTAGAIASIAFGQPTAAVDGNVKRVLARLFELRECIDEPAAIEKIWSLAESLVPDRGPGLFNQALMDLGARICVPKEPLCGECPLKRLCGACASGRQAQLPRRRPRKTVPHYEIVAAAIRKKGRYLLGKRPSEGLLGGLWEFPGGKVETGETHEEALIRELREEMDITVCVGERIASVKHAYTHFSITLHAYRCEHMGGRPRKIFHSDVKWVLRNDLHRYAFPAADLKFMDRL
ncbi:A/G-specific adenine glycosylase [Thermodesulfobacteriota bacterium]